MWHWTTTTRRSATRSVPHSRWTVCPTCWCWVPKEAEAGNISVRDRKGETTTMELDAFIAKVTDEIKNRTYNA